MAASICAAGGGVSGCASCGAGTCARARHVVEFRPALHELQAALLARHHGDGSLDGRQVVARVVLHQRLDERRLAHLAAPWSVSARARRARARPPCLRRAVDQHNERRRLVATAVCDGHVQAPLLALRVASLLALRARCGGEDERLRAAETTQVSVAQRGKPRARRPQPCLGVALLCRDSLLLLPSKLLLLCARGRSGAPAVSRGAAAAAAACASAPALGPATRARWILMPFVMSDIAAAGADQRGARARARAAPPHASRGRRSTRPPTASDARLERARSAASCRAVHKSVTR